MQQDTLAIPVSEHLFDEQGHLTRITEYGISWADFIQGKVPPPPEGARFDLAFTGKLEGPKIKGVIDGVDYLTVRADGRFMLNIQAIITTDDGAKIAFYEEGILRPSPDGPARLNLNMKFTTHDPRYSWLNEKQAWGAGTVDNQQGTFEVSAYIS